MITTHEYIITHNNSEINTFRDAEILDVAFQGEDLCLWLKVNTDNPETTRDFCIYGTGWEFDKEDSYVWYVGTAFIDNLVFHVFEKV